MQSMTSLLPRKTDTMSERMIWNVTMVRLEGMDWIAKDDFKQLK